MTMHNRRAALFAVAVGAFAACLPSVSTARQAPAPALFKVGAAAGIQFYPTQLQSANPTVKFYVSKATPQNRRSDPLSDVTWDFGDGSGAVATGAGWIEHTFPGPGNYQVYATVRNLAADNPGERTWTETIVIDEPLAVTGRVSWRAGKDTRLHAVVSGGHGQVIAAQWTCPTGEAQHGLSVTCPDTDKAGVAAVTILDGAGNLATSEVDISPARPK